MQVIFIKDLAGTAKRGDIKTVTEGYAKNYLIPNDIAHPVNSKVAKKSLQSIDAKRIKSEKLLAAQKKIFKKIEGRTFKISCKANEAGKLYAGINSKDISIIFLKNHIKVPGNEIVIHEPIKMTGTHTLSLQSGGGDSIKFYLKVTSDTIA